VACLAYISGRIILTGATHFDHLSETFRAYLLPLLLKFHRSTQNVHSPDFGPNVCGQNDGTIAARPSP
jgi:hypothetical protein